MIAMILQSNHKELNTGMSELRDNIVCRDLEVNVKVDQIGGGIKEFSDKAKARHITLEATVTTPQ